MRIQRANGARSRRDRSPLWQLNATRTMFVYLVSCYSTCLVLRTSIPYGEQTRTGGGFHTVRHLSPRFFRGGSPASRCTFASNTLSAGSVFRRGWRPEAAAGRPREWGESAPDGRGSVDLPHAMFLSLGFHPRLRPMMEEVNKTLLYASHVVCWRWSRSRKRCSLQRALDAPDLKRQELL